MASSPELNAILKACRESPADDAPRLHLADLLDEQGDADRAAFIRIQIALSHPSTDLHHQAECKALERRLLENHGETWVGDLKPILAGLRYGSTANRGFVTLAPRARQHISDWEVSFHRGLIHFGLTQAAWLLDPALRNWMRSPAGNWVEQVNIVDMNPEQFDKNPVPGEYGGLLHLEFWHRVTPWTEIEWKRFFRSRNFPLLRSLATNGGMGFLRELAQAEAGRLVALRLIGCEAEPDAARVLAQVPFESLSSLDIGPVTDADVRILTQAANLRGLADWNLVSSPILDGGLIALCESPLAESLLSVSFQNTGIGDAGVAALVGSTLFGRLNSPILNLMMNDIGDTGVAAIAGSEHLLRYRELVLRDNQCGDVGAAALAESEFAANLTYVDFWRNRIADTGAIALAHSPHLNKIVDLSVKENNVGGNGAAALFERYRDRAKV